MKSKKTYHQEYYQKNKARLYSQNKEWAKNNPKKTKSCKIKHKYGISLEEYTARFEAQQGRCGICQQSMVLGKASHLDHCHESKKLREFLCQHCNRGLGSFKDNILVLSAAIDYLKRFGGSLR